MASLAPKSPSVLRDRTPARLWPWAAACVLALQALLVLTHEPWMDEWQALQIALGAPDLRALVAALHYEGHPPLWYLVLRAAALVVPGPYVLPAVLLPIALTIQALILRLDLPRWERLAVALHYTILIEAGSISRSLSLGILLLILAFSARGRALRWGAIALLPMADFLFGLLSLVAIAAQWRDGRLWKPGLMLWGIMAALAALSVIPAPDMATAMPVADLPMQMVRAATSLSPLLVPVHMIGTELIWDGAWYPVPLAMAAGPIFLLLAHFLLRDAPFERLLLALFTGACLIVTLCFYWLSVRHFALVGLLLILLRVRAGRPVGTQSTVWRIWLGLGAAGGLLGAALSLIQPFDTGRLMAAEIIRRDLAREDIVAFQEGVVQGIGVLAGREFTSLSKGCTESFRLWNRGTTIDAHFSVYRALADYADRRGHFYLVSNIPFMPSRAKVPMRELASVPRGYDGYDYHLYELAWDRPRKAPRPGPCLPARRPVAQWYGTSP